MKKFNYFDFLRGKKVTIREILEKECTSEATYFELALNETDEKVHIGVEPKSSFMIKPNAKLFYADKKEDVKGYTKWKNGICPRKI